MKKRLLLLLTGLLLAAAVAFLVVSRPSPTDTYRYQGKTVRQWLQNVYTTNHVATMNAFHIMGTNAIPDLVHELRQNDTWLNRFQLFVYPCLPAFFKDRFQRPFSQKYICGRAQSVLGELTHKLRPKQAFASLVKFLPDKDPDVRGSVFTYLLLTVGPGCKDSVPALMALTRESDLDIKAMAAVLLWKIDGQTNTAVNALREVMNSSKNCYMKDSAPEFLFEINPRDISLIPVFITDLEGNNYALQICAVMYLKEYGAAAMAAVPALTNLLNSTTNHSLQSCSLQALQTIDPDTAAKYRYKRQPARQQP